MNENFEIFNNNKKQQQQLITTNDIFILTFKWMEKVFSFLVFRQLE